MTDKIFLRIGAWYKSTHKALVSDIDITALVTNSSAQYPEVQDVVVAVYKKTTTITNDQIKALPTTSVELVPAPGAGKLLLYNGAVFRVPIQPVNYIGIVNYDTLHVVLPGASNQGNGIYYEVGVVTDLLNLLTDVQGGDFAYFDGPLIQLAAGTVYRPRTLTQGVSAANQPLRLVLFSNSSIPWTGGNVANTLEVTVFYSIIDFK